LWIFLTRVLPPSSRRISIFWRIDNTTALAHVKKEGGLCGRALLEAKKILLLAHHRQLCLLPVFIPSAEDIQADAASRFQSIPDWHLSPKVFDLISSVRGLLLIDRFASRQSAQMRRFFGWDAADRPKAINALSQRWDFSLVYLFLPIPLLKRVVTKLETYLLVTPFWNAQTWFASLQALVVEDVRCLPISANLIDLTTGEPPQNLDRLFLVVWTILGGVGASTPSQTDHSISSRNNPQRALRARMAVLQGLPLPFLHSIPSGLSEGCHGLSGAPL
jgi:hypothetical protein